MNKRRSRSRSREEKRRDHHSRGDDRHHDTEFKKFSNPQKYLEHYDPVKVGFKDGRGVACHDKALYRALNSDCNRTHSLIP